MLLRQDVKSSSAVFVPAAGEFRAHHEFSMPVNRRLFSAGAALAATVAFAPEVSFAADMSPLPTLRYDLDEYAPPAPEPLTEVATDENPAIRCLAKVVHHEARNQPRDGQVAVAQTLINRLNKGGRFGGTICEVANQPGQYFNTVAYHPREDSEDWKKAVAAARDALSGATGAIAPGAIFFRAAYAPTNTFFRSRQRITAIGDHVFYR